MMLLYRVLIKFFGSYTFLKNNLKCVELLPSSVEMGTGRHLVTSLQISPIRRTALKLTTASC
ncbi:unnamed protein product [Leptidea sinapis]|uniref:Uncharacterized protein n=1 Tax=Leptidea sinapis TaxID=189913 RepID=A0A5E4Q7Y8_9NEOP|nr:unnamed protein product [Leptidea sinapis]